MTLSTPPNLPLVVARVKVAPRHRRHAGCARPAPGVHAALVPEHLLESRPLGLAFAVDALLLALAALVVRDPRHDSWAPATAALLLGATAVGLPALPQRRDPGAGPAPRGPRSSRVRRQHRRSGGRARGRPVDHTRGTLMENNPARRGTTPFRLLALAAVLGVALGFGLAPSDAHEAASRVSRARRRARARLTTRRRGTRRSRPSTTRCASSGRTTSPGPDSRSSPSPTGPRGSTPRRPGCSRTSPTSATRSSRTTATRPATG